MTDGPFRNAKLTKPWKQYGDDLVNEACNLDDRIAKAYRSMIKDIPIKKINNLLNDLKSLAQSEQMDLYPSSSIKEIFNRHTQSPLITDTLNRNLNVQIQDNKYSITALEEAVKTTAVEWAEKTRERINDECILAHDKGDISSKEYSKALNRNKDVFNAMDHNVLSQVLFQGSKVFNRIISKKDGLDDGPE